MMDGRIKETISVGLVRDNGDQDRMVAEEIKRRYQIPDTFLRQKQICLQTEDSVRETGQG